MSDGSDPLADTAAASPAHDGTVPAGPASGAVAARAGGLAAGASVGRYVVLKQLGRGGMGVVYAAHDPDLDRKVAVKLLHAHLSDQHARLLQEGQAVAKLRHPNVVTVFDVGDHGDGLFIAMELVDGCTLREWLERAPQSSRDVVRAFVAAARGLAAAHDAGIVHRDFKPDNVLVGSDARIVVTDFGLARSLSTAEGDTLLLTQTGALVGTPAYMSPEQFRGETVDARSDQFSFCVALFEAFAGRRPFAGDTIEELRSAVLAGAPAFDAKIPRRVVAVLRRGLAVDPEERFASMTDLIASLEPPPRWPWIAGSGALLAGATAIAIVASWPAARDECERAALALQWSPMRRASVAARFTKAELAQFDEFERGWRSAREAACRSEREGSERARAQAQCLEAARTSFEGLLVPVRERTMWPAIPSLARCREGGTSTVTVTRLAFSREGFEAILPSPSGGKLAWIGNPEEVEITDDRGKPLARHALAGRNPFEWRGEGELLLLEAGHQASALDVATGVVRPVELPADWAGLSPTGTVLRIADGRLGTTADDGAWVDLGRVPFEDARSAAWSPSGRTALIANEDRLYIVETSRRWTKAIEVPGYATPVALDDHRAVIARATTSNEFWSLRWDDRGVLVEPPELRYRSELGTPLFPARGRDAVLAVESVLLWRLERVRDGKSESVPRSVAGSIENIASDGRTIAITSGKGVGTFDLAAHTFTPVDDASRHLAFDGEGMLVDVSGRIAALDAARPTQFIDRTPPGNLRRLQCATESRRCLAAYVDGMTLHLAHWDNDRISRTVDVPLAVDDFVDIGISPDGSEAALATVRGGTSLAFVDLASGRRDERPLALPGCTLILRVAWARSGLHVSALCGPDRTIIYLVDRAGAPIKVYDANGYIGSFVVAPDALFVMRRLSSSSLLSIRGL